MYKFFYVCAVLLVGLLLLPAVVSAQEFPIAAGTDSTFSSGAAFDGTNFLVGILGDSTNPNEITAQLVSTDGSLVGDRISLGATGGWPQVAFDGTNYLIAWSNGDNVLSGQFVSTSGSLVGTTFAIANNASFSGSKGGALAFGDTTYMVMYQSNSVTYGQRVGKSGNLIGAPAQIAGAMHDNAIAFDGTNYLIAWDATSDQEYVRGQFVSAAGNLVGSSFLIDDSPNYSDNPLSIAYDGSRFLVCFHDQPADTNLGWNLYARFVSTGGTISDRVTIRDSSYDPIFPMAAFDGSDYLVTWSEKSAATGMVSLKGRFFDTSGNPVDTAFTLFNEMGGKVPLPGFPVFGGGKYLVVVTRVDLSMTGDQLGFSNGDVYGMIVNPVVTAVKEGGNTPVPKKFSLSQNYPNPFNPSTVISYQLSAVGHVTLKVYDLLGREVATLVNEVQKMGRYEARFDGSRLPSGVYFYRLSDGTHSATKKLLLLK